MNGPISMDVPSALAKTIGDVDVLQVLIFS